MAATPPVAHGQLHILWEFALQPGVEFRMLNVPKMAVEALPAAVRHEKGGSHDTGQRFAHPDKPWNAEGGAVKRPPVKAASPFARFIPSRDR
jgi:hypothetical protein